MTFTVLGFCARTGEIGLASATVSIAVGARLGQRLEAGGREWIIASQAVARPGLGFEAADLLAGGAPLDSLEPLLHEKDPYLSYRQLGILERGGGHFIYTGKHNTDWKGHVAGPGFVALGNYLDGPAVVEAMAGAFADVPSEPLAERMVRALEAGRDAGGQSDAEGNHEPELSAFVRVFDAKADAFVYGGGRSPVLDLRVDFDSDAVAELRRLYDECAPLRAVYELRGADPVAYLERSARWELELLERTR